MTKKITNTRTANDKGASTESNKTQSPKRHLMKHTAVGAIIGIFMAMGAEAVLAVDLDAGGEAITKLWTGFFNKYYAVGIVASGVGGAVIAQGDPKTRWIGFGSGCLVGGLTVMGVKAAYGI